MAIKIPSKHIYQVDNKKVRDNIINKVEINTKKIGIEVDEYKNVKSFEFVDNICEEYNDTTLQQGNISQSGDSVVYGAYIKLIPYKTVQLTLTIPKIFDNKTVRKVYYGAYTDNGVSLNHINISIKAERYSGVGKAKLNINYNTKEINITDLETSYTTKIEDIYYTKDAIIQEETGVNNPLKYSYTASVNITSAWDSSLPYITNYSNPLYEEYDDKYIIKIWLNTGYESIKLGGYLNSGTNTPPYVWVGNNIQESDYDDILQEIYTVYGYDGETKCEKVIPKILDISINGEIISINIEDILKQFSKDKTDKPYSFDSNELLQDTAKVTTEVGDTLLSEYLADNVLAQYESGKETATILCSISDYLDTNGNTAISIQNEIPYDIENITFVNHTISIPNALNGNLLVDIKYTSNQGEPNQTTTIKIYKGETSNHYAWGTITEILNARIENLPMTFDIGDIVIPYIYGANGVDKPMSLNKDGNPKEFRVVGTKKYYDGAVWQELTLQEN